MDVQEEELPDDYRRANADDATTTTIYCVAMIHKKKNEKCIVISDGDNVEIVCFQPSSSSSSYHLDTGAQSTAFATAFVSKSMEFVKAHLSSNPRFSLQFYTWGTGDYDLLKAFKSTSTSGNTKCQHEGCEKTANLEFSTDREFCVVCYKHYSLFLQLYSNETLNSTFFGIPVKQIVVRENDHNTLTIYDGRHALKTVNRELYPTKSTPCSRYASMKRKREAVYVSGRRNLNIHQAYEALCSRDCVHFPRIPNDSLIFPYVLIQKFILVCNKNL